MVDASIIVEYVLKSRVADQIDLRINERGESLHVPHFIDLEVVQVIRRFTLRGVDPERGRLAIQLLGGLKMTRYSHEDLVPRIWALRHNFSAYDAAYIALAEALSVPLITRDAAIAAPGRHTAVVELV